MADDLLEKQRWVRVEAWLARVPPAIRGACRAWALAVLVAGDDDELGRELLLLVLDGQVMVTRLDDEGGPCFQITAATTERMLEALEARAGDA